MTCIEFFAWNKFVFLLNRRPIHLYEVRPYQIIITFFDRIKFLNGKMSEAETYFAVVLILSNCLQDENRSDLCIWNFCKKCEQKFWIWELNELDQLSLIFSKRGEKYHKHVCHFARCDFMCWDRSTNKHTKG